MKIVKILIPFFMMSFIFAGCQGVTPVNTKTLKKPAVKASGEILIGDMALEVRKESANVVGYHSFTVFALRTVPIHAEYPPGMQTAMTKNIYKAINKAGYTPVVVPKGVKADKPVLRGEIRKFWYSSYWWVWPIVMVSGEIDYRLILDDAQGNKIWEKRCKGGSFMVLPSFANVDFLVKNSATTVCNKVVDAITSKEFQAKLNE